MAGGFRYRGSYVAGNQRVAASLRRRSTASLPNTSLPVLTNASMSSVGYSAIMARCDDISMRLAWYRRYLTQRAAHIPQVHLVIVHLAYDALLGLVVFQLYAVHLYLVPRHEHRLVRAHALLGSQPLVMEIIAHAVGGAFESYDGKRLQGDAAAHRADEIFGRTLVGVAPERHLAQVCHAMSLPRAASCSRTTKVTRQSRPDMTRVLRLRS